MRYSKLHEPGVKPPKNTLDAQRWADLEPATPQGLRAQVGDGDDALSIHVKKHSEQVLRTLMCRPLKSASRCRISQYTSALRELGVNIDTEGFRSDYTGRDSYGVYFLRDTVVEVQQ